MTRQASRRLCNAKTSSDASEAQQVPELLSKPLVCLGAGRIGHTSLVLLGLAWEKSEAQPKPLVGPKKQIHSVRVAQRRRTAPMIRQCSSGMSFFAGQARLLSSV